MAYNTTYSTYVSHQSSEQMNVMYFKVLTIFFMGPTIIQVWLQYLNKEELCYIHPLLNLVVIRRK